MSIKLKKTFQQIDIFGLNLAFRIAKEKNHKTWIGGIITVIISGLMLYQLQYLMQSLIQQESPSVVQQQNYVYQPELFSINPKTFSFAFGMQNSVGVHFQNETIYKIIGIQQENHRVFNQTTNNYDLITVFKEIKISQCTSDHFQIEDVRNYFLKLPFKNLYCISLEQSDLSIEGEFSALVFKQINLQVIECTQKNCTDPQARQAILSNSRLAIYTSDNIVQVTNKDKPYQTVGKNLFWIYSTLLESEIRYQIINNYLFTDKGIVTTHNTTDRIVNYSSDRVQVYGKTTSRMFNFYIVYEKNKEIAYFRSYLKLNQALSQLGGIFNLFLIIGGLLSRPISQIELNRKLINKVFDFDDTQEITENLKKNQQKNVDSPQNLPKQTQVPKKQQLSPQRQSQLQGDLNYGGLNKKKKERQKTIKNQADCNLNENQQNDQDKTKKKLNFTDYIMSIFGFFQRKKANKSELIQISSDIIYNQIDVFNIINKLIEFEKLKNLLLNEEQLKLFDYLPKPKLNQKEIKSNIQNPQRRKSRYSASFRRNNTINSQMNEQIQQQSDFIISVEKPKDEKLQDAIQAFSTIQGRKKSNLDLKLISMVNQNFMKNYNLFQIQNQSQVQNKKISIYDQDCIIQDSTHTVVFSNKNSKANFQLLTQEEYYSRNQSPRNNLKTPRLLTNLKAPIGEFKSDESIDIQDINTAYHFKNNECQLSKHIQK
ncbi:hypothetical protein ABPG72_016414 [Tetrahymena utriculariae]